ncbi:hypothetical protein [Elioraea sp.]|uniref:hypothetical protein n=1 Tax=Elioraea sp. TaxID=2185103 RepID=UPI0025C6DB0E|nr:hypothetical protein [Elioraea sp.]
MDMRIPGLPDWANLVIVVLGLMIALAWVLMPFSVFGVKGRIEAVEARLEVIHEEIRQLNLRIAQAGWRSGPDFAMPAEAPTLRRPGPVPPEPQMAPPIPPPPVVPERSVRPMPAPPHPAGRPEPGMRAEPTLPLPNRAEPKLSWPPRG